MLFFPGVSSPVSPAKRPPSVVLFSQTVYYNLLLGVLNSFLRCVRPFPLAMQHFYSFVSQVISLLLSPRFGACTAGVRPFPLAMQHFYSFPPVSLSPVLSPFLLVTVSTLSPFCLLLFPFLFPFFLRARSYAGVVFMRFCCVFLSFCHVLKEFPRLRSRYVLVLLFPKQTNFSFLKQPLGPTLPFLAHKHSHCCKGSTFWASPSTFFMKWASPSTFLMKWREDQYLETQCAHQAQQKLRSLLSSTGPG